MTRLHFNIVAALFWIAFAVLARLNWPLFVREFGENAGEYGGSILLAVALAGLVIQAFAADRLVVRRDDAKKETEKERIERVERDAQAEIKTGGIRRAIAIYESEGFIMKALTLADAHGEREAVARLALRLGRYGRALELFRELGNYEAAAHAAVLARKPREARALYREAVLQCPAGTGPAVLAGLYDRAGDPACAAPLYEEAGDLRRAAECYDLCGMAAEAAKVTERAAVVEAYERRKDPGPRKAAAPPVDERKAALEAATVFAGVGDMFGAAQAWRDAVEYRKAAEAFEMVEEWERAARCHEKAKNPARAEELRKLAEATAPRTTAPIPAAAPPASPAQAAPALPAPPAPTTVTLVLAAPGSVSAPAFQPAGAQAQQFIPIFVPMPGPGATPQSAPLAAGGAAVAAHDLATMFEAGNYAAISRAAAAVPPAMWLEAARALEAEGNLAAAADLYRSMGRIENARQCLERAERPVDAAMLAMATGDRRTAQKILRARLDSAPDREAGLMLGELLIEAGRYYQALRVLHETLAPEGCTEANASLFYHFARRFEDAGANAEAKALYGEMVASGATSKEIADRIERLARLSGDSTALPKADASPRKSAEDFLKAAIAEETSSPESKKPQGPPPRAFPFSPPRLRGRIPIAGAGGSTDGEKAPPLVLRELSLFGNPIDDAQSAISTAATPTGAAPVVQRPDPFAASQRYELVRELGRGGMGVVYEAKDRTLGRSLVIKVIGKSQSDSRAIEQFLMEARAIARLNHRNIVTIYDFGMLDLQHYIAMEMVRGKDLKTLVESRTRLGAREALNLFNQIARGLGAAHKAGVVHRDIKPANVLLTEENEVRIVDFGLAKLADAARTGPGGDQTLFRAAGTPGYMAPEQIRGEEVMPACDIYSLGMTLFAMIVGGPPHRAMGIQGSNAIIEFQLAGKYPKMAEFVEGVPPVVEQAYEYCTKPNPGDRYQSVDGFLPTLEKWAEVL